MAITFIKVPDEHTPAYNNQYFVASGTNVAQTNFKYVVTVWVDGESTELKYPPDPDDTFLYFNPQRIVESYVKTDYLFDIDEPTCATDSIKQVIVAVDEEYGSPVSGFTGTSGDYFVWNAAYNAHDFSAYTFTTSANIKQLTLAPNTGVSGVSTSADKIHFDTKYLMKSWHLAFGNLGTDGYQLEVIAYDSSLNILNDTYIYNSFYVTPYPENEIATVNCSPYGLNLIKTNNAPLILSQTDPTADPVPVGTYFYILKWYNGATPPLGNSIVHEVVIDSFCSRYTRYVVHFLNRLGNYDSFTFNLVSVDEANKETKEYRNNPMVLTGSSYNYSNSKSDRQNYNTVITNKVTLNSDWVTDAQYQWLKDLFMSPSIKLESSTGALYAVTCKVKNYKESKRVNDKIFNVTIELEYDYQDIRQRG